MHISLNYHKNFYTTQISYVVLFTSIFRILDTLEKNQTLLLVFSVKNEEMQVTAVFRNLIFFLIF